MDRDKARKVSEAMQEALGLIEKDFGVKFKVGNGTYNESGVTFKVEAAELSKDGLVLGKETVHYRQFQKRYGLPDLWTVVSFGGKQYKIVGLKPRADKFPVLAQRDGRTFKLSVEQAGGKDPYKYNESPTPL